MSQPEYTALTGAFAGAPRHSYIVCIKDPYSALTHLFGFLFAIIGAAPLLLYTARHKGGMAVAAVGAFLVCMAILYLASTMYHALYLPPKQDQILRKIDHISISLLIAGTYTPVCLLNLPHSTGYPLLVAVWSVALAGAVMKLCWITCPKWVSSVLYIGMGWLCIFAFPALFKQLSPVAWALLFFGGVAYTVGGVVYALTPANFNLQHPQFGTHEIFHVFVLVGSFLHYAFMFVS